MTCMFRTKVGLTSLSGCMNETRKLDLTNMKHNLPEQDVLLSYYYYEDGHIYSKRYSKQLGSVNSRGYMVLPFRGKNYLVHRLIWRMVHGTCPPTLDHIDGNRMNNRIENLREVTRSQNALNTGTRRNNKSGHKGVFWNSSKGKWEAQLNFNGEYYFLGNFADLEDAVKARLQKESEVVSFGG